MQNITSQEKNRVNPQNSLLNSFDVPYQWYNLIRLEKQSLIEQLLELKYNC